jgi:flagellar biosynthesis/type III secretory pathway chaperone
VSIMQAQVAWEAEKEALVKDLEAARVAAKANADHLAQLAAQSATVQDLEARCAELRTVCEQLQVQNSQVRTFLCPAHLAARSLQYWRILSWAIS